MWAFPLSSKRCSLLHFLAIYVLQLCSSETSSSMSSARRCDAATPTATVVEAGLLGVFPGALLFSTRLGTVAHDMRPLLSGYTSPGLSHDDH